MRPALRETSTAGSDTINLTPLLDVLFLILFFFLMATEAKREVPAVEVDLPEIGKIAETRDTLPDDIALLTITRDGEVFLDKEEVGIEGLADALIALDSSRINDVMIRVDGSADSELLIRAMTECAEANFASTLVEHATDSSSPTRSR